MRWFSTVCMVLLQYITVYSFISVQVGAVPFTTVDMGAFSPPSQGVRLVGGSGIDSMGTSVSSAGDVNGDGYGDIIVGAEFATMNSKTGSGTVWVFFGRATGFTQAQLYGFTAAGSNGFAILAEFDGDHLGKAVSGAGDVNGDGYDDIMVSAHLYDTNDGGLTCVIFGHPVGYAWTNIDIASYSFTTSTGYKILGPAVSQSGISISYAGDVNRDGRPDMIIGARLTNSNAGTSFVLFGKPRGSTYTPVSLTSFTSGSGGFIIYGAAAGDNSGAAVGGGGDFNGDGCDDVLVGAQLASSGGKTYAGAAYVVFGHLNTTTFTDVSLSAFPASASTGFTIKGGLAGDQLGSSVTFAGDVNNDGYDDILVAAITAGPYGRSFAGMVYVIFGRSTVGGISNIDLANSLSGPFGFRIVGKSTSAQFGTSISRAGDFNRDGIDDLIVGAPYEGVGGTVYLLYGQQGWNRGELDLRNFTSAGNAAGWLLKSSVAGDQLGVAVNSAGDFNKDGINDIVVTAITADTGGTDSGVAYIIYGRDEPTAAPTIRPTATPSLNPSVAPSQPTSQPSRQPSSLPTSQPSRQPSSQPTSQPSRQPTSQPSRQPSTQPSTQPTCNPTNNAFSFRDIDTKYMASNSRLGYKISSSQSNMGRSVAGAGDFNGDGHADFMVTSSLSKVGILSGGTVYLIFGTGLPGPPSWLDFGNFTTGAGKGLRIYGGQQDDLTNIAAAGDVNNDGYDDLLVGAPDGAVVGGAAYLIFGHGSGAPFADIYLPDFHSGPASGVRIVGAHTGERTGATVSPAGDLNGDGCADIIVGANIGPSWRGTAGSVYVLFGHPVGYTFRDVYLVNMTAGPTTGYRITGANLADNLGGSAIDSAGDANGDGRLDLLLLAQAADPPGANNAGIAYLLYGQDPAHSTVTDIDLAHFNSSAAAGFRILGYDPSAPLTACNRLGDFNGDGADDVVVGAQAGSVGGSANGIAFVVFGRKGSGSTADVNLQLLLSASTVGFSVSGATANEQFGGTSVKGAGDVNGDGLMDLVVGARSAFLLGRSNCGAVYVIYGRSTNVPINPIFVSDWGPSDSMGFRIVGAATGYQLGKAVAVAGDLNGDGASDIIVTVPVFSTFKKIIVIYGTKDMRPTSQPSSQPSRQPSAQPTMQPTCSPTNNAFSYRDIDTKYMATNSRLGYQVSGAITSGSLGRSVAGAGDFNGDGHADFMVSASVSKSGVSSGGAVYLIFGTGQPGPPNELNFGSITSGSGKGLRIYGGDGEDIQNIAAAGDVNNDGYDDVLIGAPAARSYAGAVYLIFGHGNNAPFVDIALPDFRSGPASGVRIFGAAIGDNAGKSVASAGDLNGDGCADVLIGAFTASPIGRGSAGSVYVLFGHPVGYTFQDVYLVNMTAGPTTGYRILGQRAEDFLGVSVDAAGDVNGDGRTDLLLLAQSGDTPNAADAGIAYVLYGQDPAHSTVTDIDLAHFNSSAAAGFRILGYDSSAPLTACNRLGDFNGDGADDVVFGAQAGSVGGSANGIAFVVFGRRGEASAADFSLQPLLSASAAGFSAIGAVTNEQFGGVLAKGAGDVNGDGLADLVVGARSANILGRAACGAVYVIYGRRTVAPMNPIFTSAWASSDTMGFRIVGAVGGNQLGRSATIAGDLNGDGIPDIITAAPPSASPTGLSSAGKIVVIYGTVDKRPTSQPSSQPSSAPSNAAYNYGDIDTSEMRQNSRLGFRMLGISTSDNTGFSISNGGDVNGDGFLDLIVGAPYASPGGQTNAGAAHIVLGKVTDVAPSDVDLQLFGSSAGAGVRVISDRASDACGTAVAGGGDFNGDGLADILIGVGGKTSTVGYQGTGAVYLIFGGSWLNSVQEINTSTFPSPGQPGFKIIANNTDSYTGTTMAFLGDLNYDGFDDIAVSAYMTSLPNRTEAFVIYVLFGKSSGLADIDLHSFITSPTRGFVIIGTDQDNLGGAVQAAGDINGDGVSDAIFGASRETRLGRTSAGAAYVIFGRDSTVGQLFTQDVDLTVEDLVSTGRGFVISGAAVDDQCGIGVSTAGDINGDHFSDVLVSCIGVDRPEAQNSGAAYLIFGHSAGTPFPNIDLQVFDSGATATGFRLLGSGVNSKVRSVSTAGDINGDGYDDFMVGAFWAFAYGRVQAGATYVLYGHHPAAGFGNIDLATLQKFKRTEAPSRAPTRVPTSSPTAVPSTARPSLVPSIAPTAVPTLLSPTSQLFGYTGSAQTFTVPANVTSVRITVYGAAGADMVDAATSAVYSGGWGGMIASTIPVTPGQVLKVYVGGAGLRRNAPGVSGYNGGGFPADCGGGGATDVRVAPYNLTERVIVAGGGGGAGSGNGFSGFVVGGYGGYPAGGTGGGISQTGGQGGTASAGGLHGSYFSCTTAHNGRFGYGAAECCLCSGGAGGGGYYGGGAAPGAAGGGGSSFSAYAVETFANGVQPGNGYAVIEWWTGPSLSPSLAPTTAPLVAPSVAPSTRSPTRVPTQSPTRAPTVAPTALPSFMLAQPPVGFRIFGASLDKNGFSVSPAGDVNRDGYADLMIGAPGADVPGRGRAGITFVLYGSPPPEPTSLPSSQPSRQPSTQPSRQPSRQPTSQPSRRPTLQPTSQPSRVPSAQPSRRPTAQPSAQPSRQPSAQPSAYPTNTAPDFDDLDVSMLSSHSDRRGFRIVGKASSVNAGYSAAGAGDVNGDGIADLIIGAPYETFPELSRTTQVGAAYVLYGHRNTSRFPEVDLATFSSSLSNGFRVLGASSMLRMGFSVAGVGDVNKDSIDDVVIGCPQCQGSRGVVYVVYGSSARSTDVDLESFTAGSQGYSMVGQASPTNNIGYCVAGAGDVDGDGYEDIIVGGPGNVGMAYVVFGRSTSSDLTLSALPPGRGFSLTASNDNGGYAVSSAGDVNGDGYADVLIGAFNGDVPGRQDDAGIAYVVFGHSNRTAFPDILLSSLLSPSYLGFSILGAARWDHLGWRVTGAGDLNSDGYGDILVSATGADVPSTEAGITYVLFGHSNATAFRPIDLLTMTTGRSTGYRIYGSANENSGQAVGAAGDVNSDGIPDILIGSPFRSFPGRSNAGTAYVLFGQANISAVQDISLSALKSGPSTGYRVIGTSASKLGSTVSGVGDIDKDGIDDYIVTAPEGSDYGRSACGLSYVLFGADKPPEPTSQPSSQPSGQPSRQPSRQPTAQPSRQPATVPTGQPSQQPLSRPSGQPSGQPTLQPSRQPTALPTGQPSQQPLSRPSGQPSGQPTLQPFRQPSGQPTVMPTRQPSTQPTGQPSSQPTCRPTHQPSSLPSRQPSGQPSARPSRQPAGAPTSQPSVQLSGQPTRQPSSSPSQQPTAHPSVQPTGKPSGQPSRCPSSQPTGWPTVQPSAYPSALPSTWPTAQPTRLPSGQPTVQPSSVPTCEPSTRPSSQPSCAPSAVPSSQPSCAPSGQPSALPSVVPSAQPSCQPGALPTSAPSSVPSWTPSGQPSDAPSAQPSGQPSGLPSTRPSSDPTSSPSLAPSAQPTCAPSAQPSQQPSGQPTSQPTLCPSAYPSTQPSTTPSSAPSSQPTVEPSFQPTCLPSAQPSSAPTQQPTLEPTDSPTAQPTVRPSNQPSSRPTHKATVPTKPTSPTTAAPSAARSSAPTAGPSAGPSVKPSALPTVAPTVTVTPAITSVVVQPNRTALAVIVETAATEALVLCAALPHPGPALFAVAQVVAQNQFAISANGTAVVVLSGLTPITSYRVYCTTRSAGGSVLALSDVLANEVVETTLCCKLLTVNLLRPSVPQYVFVQSAVSVTAEFKPSAAVNVQLRFVGGTTGTAVTVVPAATTLRNMSSLTSPTLLALATSGAVELTIAVDVTGPSAGEYMVVVPRPTLTVLAASVEPATPVVTAAVFSSDGSYVTLAFDSPTNKAGYSSTFPCPTLLTFIGSAAATCVWADSAHISLYLKYTYGAIIAVGSTVAFRANTTRALCTGSPTECARWKYVAPCTLTVAAPTTSQLPKVILAVPSVISGCNSLPVDLSASSGAAGRPWSQVQFAVQAQPDTGSAAANRLRSFLQRNCTLDTPTLVPAAVLERGTAYTIQATLCNFLGACGSATASVSVHFSQDAVPMVTILGASERVVKRADAFVLASSAYVTNCDRSVSRSGLDYSWTLAAVSADGSAVPLGLRSASQSPAVFRLVPFSLAVGKQYQVTLTVRSQQSQLASSAAVLLTVQASDVVAVISGGAFISVQAGDRAVVDASRSYDADVPNLYGVAAGLQFAWTCVQRLPEFSLSCPLGVPSLSVTSSVLNATTSAATVNTTSIVAVTVSDANGRKNSAQVEVTITAAPRPQIEITTTLSSVSNVNANKDLVLLGKVRSQIACTAQWSADDVGVDLAAVADTPLSGRILPSTSPVPFNLVVRAGALPQRAEVTFSLSCNEAATSFVITTNGAPMPGQFMVSPESGDELVTMFQFTATLWSDPDLPLTYQFGFESAASLSNLVIVSRAERSYASSVLPAGSTADGNTITCQLQVFDALAASTTTEAEVTVLETATEARLSSLRSLALWDAGDVDGTKTVISVVSTALNSANCTGMASFCIQQNRNPCLRSSGECGPCLQGYVGDSGDSSALCIPAAEALATTAEVACITTSDCPYTWQLCDPLSGQCVAPAKTCSRNCSGNGECIYQNRLTGAQYQLCRLPDQDCDAQCACRDGYTGKACEISPGALRERRALRSNLLSSLQNLTAMEDVNTESVQAWSASLYTLALNPFELSVRDAERAAAVANATLQQARLIGGTAPAAMLGVLQAVDAVASVRAFNYNPNDYRLDRSDTALVFPNNTAIDTLTVVSVFADLMADALVLGQNETVFRYDNFRVSAGIHWSSTQEGNVTVIVPHASGDADTLGSSAALVPAYGEEPSAVVAKVVVVHPRAYSPNAAAFLSSPVYLQLTPIAADAQAADPVDQLLSELRFTLHHNDLQAEFYRRPTALNFTSRCSGHSAAENYSYVCPGSGVVLVHNCSQGAGVYTSHCPVPVSACAVLDPVTVDMALPDSCRVISYNASYTMCSCKLKSNGEARRSLASLGRTANSVLDASGATNVLATTVYIATDFADTFNAADNLTSLAALRRVFIVIAVIASLWGCGVLLFVADYLRPDGKKGARPEEPNADEARQHVLRYVETTIPGVFSENVSFLRRIARELVCHHLAFQLYAAGTVRKRREVVFKLLTTFTFMIFLVCVFFDAGSPDDDGSCPTKTDVDTCLQRRSPFDNELTYCAWSDEPQPGLAPCQYNTQELSTKAMLYLSFLITVLTAIMTIPNDYLLGIIHAPSVESLRESRIQQMSQLVGAGVRRLSNAANAAGAALRRASARASQVMNDQRRSSLIDRISELLQAVKDGDLQANRAIPEEVVQVRSLAGRQTIGIAANSIALQQRDQARAGALRSQSMRFALEHTRVEKGTGACHEGSSDDGSNAIEVRSADVTNADIESSGQKGDLVAGEALCDEVLLQRAVMRDEAAQTAVFDRHWNIMHSSSNGATSTVRLNRRTRLLIAQAVRYADKQAAELKTAVATYSAQHAGLEILHLFMVDLLGRSTPAARIFREKFGEDFEDTQAVTMTSKACAAAVLIALNVFFVFYLVLKGYQKGPSWQVQFFLSCVAQILVELLVFETIECLWLNYSIPSFVYREVAEAAETLRSLVHKVCDPLSAGPPSPYFLNAPAHLFVSVKLAREFPHLLESAIVGSYSHHLPGRLWETWPHFRREGEVVTTLAPVEKSWVRAVVLPVLAVLVLVTQRVVTIPFIYQRVVIRFAQPLILSGITMAWYLATRSVVAVVLVSLLSAAGIAALVYWHLQMYSAGRASAKIAPDGVHQSGDDVLIVGAALDGEQVEAESASSGSSDGSSEHSSAFSISSGGSVRRVRKLRSVSDSLHSGAEPTGRPNDQDGQDAGEPAEENWYSGSGSDLDDIAVADWWAAVSHSEQEDSDNDGGNVEGESKSDSATRSEQDKAVSWSVSVPSSHLSLAGPGDSHSDDDSAASGEERGWAEGGEDALPPLSEEEEEEEVELVDEDGYFEGVEQEQDSEGEGENSDSHSMRSFSQDPSSDYAEEWDEVLGEEEEEQDGGSDGNHSNHDLQHSFSAPSLPSLQGSGVEEGVHVVGEGEEQQGSSDTALSSIGQEENGNW